MLYRWRDADETVHIRSEPPLEEVDATLIPFEPRWATGPPGPGDGRLGAPEAASREPSVVVAPWSVYTPAGFEALLRRLEETSNLLRDREEQLDELLGEL
jgi:hypothetical protein